MTPSEASNYLGISIRDDLDEAIELRLFESKQELIQKVDQVLLFSSREKKWKLLSEACIILGHRQNSMAQIEEISVIAAENIKERFHQFLTNRSKLLNQLNRISSFHELVSLQKQFEKNYIQWAEFWKDFYVEYEQDIAFSKLIDPMYFIQVIQLWENQGVSELHQLNEIEIPDEIKHEIRRLQALRIKLA